MLREFIAHIQETTKPQIIKIGESTFSIAPGGAAIEIRPTVDLPRTLLLTSLDALVKLVNTEGIRTQTPLYITVPDHKTVRCFGQPINDAYCARETYYEAQATNVPGFQDGFREHEKAIIELRSRFTPNEGTEYLLDLLSRISTESGVTSSDNGVSQTVEARQGVSLKAMVPIKPIVPLRPYRTFQEVEQPESEFLLRLDDAGRVGLFEADGGMWMLKAREIIKAFLEQRLSEEIASGAVIVAL